MARRGEGRRGTRWSDVPVVLCTSSTGCRHSIMLEEIMTPNEGSCFEDVLVLKLMQPQLLNCCESTCRKSWIPTNDKEAFRYLKGEGFCLFSPARFKCVQSAVLPSESSVWFVLIKKINKWTKSKQPNTAPVSSRRSTLLDFPPAMFIWPVSTEAAGRELFHYGEWSWLRFLQHFFLKCLKLSHFHQLIVFTKRSNRQQILGEKKEEKKLSASQTNQSQFVCLLVAEAVKHRLLAL